MSASIQCGANQVDCEILLGGELHVVEIWSAPSGGCVILDGKVIHGELPPVLDEHDCSVEGHCGCDEDGEHGCCYCS